jgi:replicative DNA helicase
MNAPVLPQAIDAEQSVLGGLMLDASAWARIGDWLTETDFSDPHHRLIFRAIRDQILADNPVDAVTMGEWFEAHAESDITLSYLVSLASRTPSAANIVAYAEIVLEKSKLRQIIAIGDDLARQASTAGGQDSALLLSGVVRRLHALGAASQHVGPRAPRDPARDWFDALRARWESGDTMTGLPSPWHDLNTLTFGWQPGELIIVAARPNVGKSVLGFQQLAFSGLRGNRALGFSLEMTYEQVLSRMVAALGDVPHDWIRSPANRPDDHWPAVNHAVRDLLRANFLIDDQPRLTAEQMIARAKREHMRSPLSLIVVDHLHDMRRPGRDLVNEIADDCRALKSLAKDLHVPVIALAQLNRQGADRPVLKDLRASGGIEEVADAVILMHRDDYQRFDERATAPVELIVAKGRNMPAGRTVYLRNRYDIQRLDDYPDYTPPPPPERPAVRGLGGRKWGTA